MNSQIQAIEKEKLDKQALSKISLIAFSYFLYELNKCNFDGNLSNKLHYEIFHFGLKRKIGWGPFAENIKGIMAKPNLT